MRLHNPCRVASMHETLRKRPRETLPSHHLSPNEESVVYFVQYSIVCRVHPIPSQHHHNTSTKVVVVVVVAVGFSTTLQPWVGTVVW